MRQKRRNAHMRDGQIASEKQERFDALTSNPIASVFEQLL